MTQKTPASSTPSRACEGVSDRTLVNALSVTLRAANRYLCFKLRQTGLTALVPSHGDILVALFSREPITMQQLADAIDRDPSTVTALVKKLVDAGYVRTEKSAEDRRITEVVLTEKGRGLRQSFDEISSALNETQNHGVTPESLAITQQTLRQIKDNFLQAIERESEEHR